VSEMFTYSHKVSFHLSAK